MSSVQVRSVTPTTSSGLGALLPRAPSQLLSAP
jgi:hypothetical protein